MKSLELSVLDLSNMLLLSRIVKYSVVLELGEDFNYYYSLFSLLIRNFKVFLSELGGFLVLLGVWV